MNTSEMHSLLGTSIVLLIVCAAFAARIVWRKFIKMNERHDALFEKEGPAE